MIMSHTPGQPGPSAAPRADQTELALSELGGGRNPTRQLYKEMAPGHFSRRLAPCAAQLPTAPAHPQPPTFGATPTRTASLSASIPPLQNSPNSQGSTFATAHLSISNPRPPEIGAPEHRINRPPLNPGAGTATTTSPKVLLLLLQDAAQLQTKCLLLNRLVPSHSVTRKVNHGAGPMRIAWIACMTCHVSCKARGANAEPHGQVSRNTYAGCPQEPMLMALRLTSGGGRLDTLLRLPTPVCHRALHSPSCACAVLCTPASNLWHSQIANRCQQVASMLPPCVWPCMLGSSLM